MSPDGCLLHRHDPSVVTVAVPLRPHARGGSARTPEVRICAPSTRRIYALLHRIERLALDHPTRAASGILRMIPNHLDYWRDYSADERVIAYRLWLRYGADLLAGHYDDTFRDWYPDGSPKRAGVPHYEDRRGRHARRG